MLSEGPVGATPDPGRQVEGSGDYDGDGRSDVLRRQTTTGAVDMLLVDGTVVLSQGLVVTVADPNWQIVRMP